jgi:hypothetical protein
LNARSRLHGRLSCLVSSALVLVLAGRASAGTWRIGDVDQPWQLRPVSTSLDVSTRTFQPDYVWGGGYAVEIVVDDDGDGQIDEDPVDFIDNDGDALCNEDGPDGLDNDGDGLVDEDGPDPQRDNDGDGLLNEDGLMTGGGILEARLRSAAPWATRQRPGEWGDDDRDASVNEDPINGLDDDGDGLIDEDDTATAMPRGGAWTRKVFQYDAAQSMEPEERRLLEFTFDGDRGVFVAERPDGSIVVASPRNLRLHPTDWVRPILLDSTRNLAVLVEDRFLNGQFSKEPIDTGPYTGTYKSNPVRSGDRHIGMALDNDLRTARYEPGGGDLGGRFINIEFGGLFIIDRLRLYPRPQFPKRVLTHFRTYVAGDAPGDIYVSQHGEIVRESLNPVRFLLPEQIGQRLPIIKDFRLDGGELGAPQRARVVSIRTTLPTVEEAAYATAPWEVAEVEIYGSGFSLEACYVSEIIDVSGGQYRRYFDASGTPVHFESVMRDRAAQLRSFDPDSPGALVSWGQARWKGRIDGEAAAGVAIRVRTGTTPDPLVYQRQVAQGIVDDTDASGNKIDAAAYLTMSPLKRVPAQQLPYDRLSEGDDGTMVGWTPWSAPLDLSSGRVDEQGIGGVDIPVSVLSRYIQFRVDFTNTEGAAVALDYVEIDFHEPRVGGSVLAEIFPTAATLGATTDFLYVIKPIFVAGDRGGFNRMDVAVPSLEAGIDSLLVDGVPWTRVEPRVPVDLALSAGEQRAYIDSLRHDKAWLDSVTIDGDRAYAAAVYADSGGGVLLGIKTRAFRAADFRLGEEIRLAFHAPVYTAYTEFSSWVWDDGVASKARQLARPGDASPHLPADAVGVVAEGGAELFELESPPRAFTPNGDGVNDTAMYRLKLMLVTAAVDAKIEIYALSGQLVTSLGPVAVGAGRHHLVWDGRDMSGEMVAPGLYVYRVDVHTDARRQQGLGVTAVVY